MSYRVIVEPTPEQIEEVTAPIRSALAASRLPATEGGTWRVTVTNGEPIHLATRDEASQQVDAYCRAIEFGPTRSTEIDVHHLQDGTWTHKKAMVHESPGGWGTWQPDGEPYL